MAVSLSIKNVPDGLVERLRIRAKANHRSLQGELLAILEETIAARPLTRDEGVAPKRLTLEEVYQRGKSLGLPSEPLSVDIIRKDRDAR